MKPSPALPLRSRPFFRGEAFTLIELLVVISIIAILAGLLLPVVNKAMENARKTAAKSAVTQMVAAVNNYQTDYGQYPVVTGMTSYVSGSDYTFGTDGHNYQLFLVLRALNANATDGTAVLNTRRTVYFEGKNVRNASNPKDGFVQTVPTGGTFTVGDFVDPWGHAYLVRLDSNYSNAIQNPYKDGTHTSPTATDGPSIAETDVLHLGAGAMSYGFDGVVGTKGTAPISPYTAIGDDVVSWQ